MEQEKAREVIPNIIPRSSSLIASPEPRLSMTMGPTRKMVGSEDGIADDIDFSYLYKDAGAGGPFCQVHQDGTNWKLLGGTVTCGEGTETIADITIGTIATPPADGTFYWLVCDVTANDEDDVLLPGGTLNSANTGSGTSLPNNTIPEVGAIEGTIHISLGEWMNEKFIPAGCGNLQISHCPGSLTYQRDNYYGYYGYYGY